MTQVFTMTTDGARLRPLTHGPNGSEKAAWSPDGRTIAFDRQFSNHAAIFLMRANGSDLRNLTPRGDQSYPAFTPDGRSIVYVRTLATDQSLWLMDVTGRHPRRLTRSVGDEDPAVSPDGTRIAFLRGPQVFVVSANGGEARQLTPSNLEAGGRLDWSPDGSRILFGANDQVYTIRLDGSGLTKLTSGKHAYCSDSFSPDGRRVLLIDNCGSATNSQLYSMSVGGGHPVPVRNGLGAHWISLGTAR